jgi:tetratricopeptide (TPR) repeat protein
MGNYKRAENWYRKAVREKPLSTNLVFLGACLAKQGKFIEAKKYHLESIEVNTQESDEAFYNLGLISRAEESYKEAKKYFEKAIEICPDYPVAIDALRDINKLLKLQKKKKC